MSDVIHDIGFRRYEGERFGRGWIVRSLLVDTIRGIFGLGRPARSKVMPWLLVGILALPPIVIGLVVLITGADQPPISYTQYLYQLNLPISLFLAGSAPYAVSRDLRHGVMSLYLSRPLMRSDYLAARYAGLLISMFAIMAVPQTLLMVAALLAELPVDEQLVGWAGGLLMSALLAVLLAAFGLAVAAITPRRGVGVAAIITILLVVQGFSFALSGLASEQDLSDLAVVAGALDPYRLIDGLSSWVLGVDAAIGEFAPTAAWQAGVLALAWLLGVLGFGGLLLRRYRNAVPL